MAYLMGAYAVFWLITFVLVFSIERRQKALEQKMESLLRKNVRD